MTSHPASSLDVTFDEGLGELTSAERDALLESAQHEIYHRGQVILAESQPNDCLYVIAQGTVRIERRSSDGTASADGRSSSVLLARLGRGAIFGEVAFLADGGAAATVVAEDGVGAFRVCRSAIDALAERDPTFTGRLYRSLAVTLANRLRSTNRRLR